MTFEVPVRVTRTRRCREGFYLVINGKGRLLYKRRADAIKEVQAVLSLQKFQVCTVREYAERHAKKIQREMEAAR